MNDVTFSEALKLNELVGRCSVNRF